MRLRGIITLVISFWHVTVDVSQARDAYFRSATTKKDALFFELLLDSVKEDAVPVLVCYKGAAEMLKANNATNPINKFTCFNRGKNLIQQSIARDSSCIESHFIRYSIQRNLPGFLRYDKNIHQDSILIVKGLDNMTDRDLKNKITAYFNQSKAHTKNEQ